VGGNPAAASIRKTGDAIRIFWAKPVHVEPGKPLTVEMAF
jgi:hypothetical protein